MATNVMFAEMKATRAIINYTRQNANEASRITTNRVRTIARTAKQTIQIQEEE